MVNFGLSISSIAYNNAKDGIAIKIKITAGTIAQIISNVV
jgi:hypothetical protein